MSFTSQKYKKYFTLNHNGPKNVRTVQMIASIGVEMMPAGVDVGYGWVYINKVGQGCITRSLAVPSAGAKMPQKVLSLYRAPPYAAVRGGGCCREGLGTMADLLGLLFFSCFCPMRSIPLCNNVCVDNHAVSVCLTAVYEC